MPVTIPTTAQQAAANKANIEARLNQTSPAADKAFNNVEATMEAMAFTSLYKYAADRVTANLVISAQGADLDYLGQEYGIARFTAVSAVVTATLAATDGTIVPIGTLFSCSANGLQYVTAAQYTAPYPGGAGTGFTVSPGISLTCTTAGAGGNLSNSSTLNIQSPIAGAGTVATVASTSTTGADAELDPAYRGRILSFLQTLPNGSNSASYRLWAQSVAGVAKAYPYSGSPYNSGITSYPGMRTVYIKGVGSSPNYGVWYPATQTGSGLCYQVAQAIISNPNTGQVQQDLGLVNTTLYIVPVNIVQIYVTITGLSVPSGLTSACQADITTALQTFLLGIQMYIAGVDPVFGRNDTVSGGQMYTIAQTVLTSYGATIQNLAFGTGAGNAPSYTLNPGETLALNTPVTFA